jgi:hypothetical protein
VIPDPEIQMFEACVRDAWNLARAGRWHEGYARLDLGLTWAETPAIDPVTMLPEAPDPWTEELVGIYRAALMRYADAHAVPAEEWAPLAGWSENPSGWSEFFAHAAPHGELMQRAQRLQRKSQDLCTRARAIRSRAERARLKSERQRSDASTRIAALCRNVYR